jgi:hypothetical protein
MSALPSGSGLAARLAPARPKTNGFLNIVRHGAGPGAIYVLTYHRLDGGLERVDPSAPENYPERPDQAVGVSAKRASLGASMHPKPVLAEGAHALIELLEKIGVDFKLG